MLQENFNFISILKRAVWKIVSFRETFKPSSFLLVKSGKTIGKSELGNLSPSRKIPYHVNSFRDDWILQQWMWPHISMTKDFLNSILSNTGEVTIVHP